MNRRWSLQSLFKRSIDGPLVLLLLPNGASVGSKHHMATVSDGDQSANRPKKQRNRLLQKASPSRQVLVAYWNGVMRAEEEALKKTRPWQTLDYIPLHDQKSILSSVKGECLHNNYHFGGKPSSFSPKTQEELNEEICKKYEQEHGKRLDDLGWFERWKAKKDIDARIADSCSVVQLQYPFGPAIAAPTGVDPTQWREIFRQARVYLLGCTHYTEEARKNAESLVAAVQPDVVMVEMCHDGSKSNIVMAEGESKAQVLKTQEEEEFCEEKYKKFEQEHGKLLDGLGWFGRRKLKKELQRMYLTAKRELQILMDNEHRAAFFAAQKVPGCAGIVLGDLPYSHSAELQQMKSAEKQWIVRMDKLQRDNIKTNLVDKRDKHMVSVLHTMLHRCTIEKMSASKRIGVEFEPVTAIAVVGKGHLKGMKEKWSKPEQVYPSQ